MVKNGDFEENVLVYDEIYKNGKLQNEICKLKFAKGNLQNLFFQWNM